MIYVDTSVILARLFGEARCPAEGFWEGELVASRLAEYELWVRVNAYHRAKSHGALAKALLARLTLLPVDEEVVARCRAPYPVELRTLDAIHLATADFLRARGTFVEVATYDDRMARAAAAMGFGVTALIPLA